RSVWWDLCFSIWFMEHRGFRIGKDSQPNEALQWTAASSPLQEGESLPAAAAELVRSARRISRTPHRRRGSKGRLDARSGGVRRWIASWQQTAEGTVHVASDHPHLVLP